jgi:hypothetical protein
MAQRKIVTRDPRELREHPLHRTLYGPPTANSAYSSLKKNIELGGLYDEAHPLIITEDGRVIAGRTRRAIAIALKLPEVRCVVFVPSSPDPAEAELEIETKVIADNDQRTKTQLMIAREQRHLLEIQTQLARRRMGQGGDGGPSKSVDRVAEFFNKRGDKTESGKTVQRRIKILEAVEAAEAAGDRRKADRLTELLNNGQTVKALEVISPREKSKKPVKVEVPPTLHGNANKAYSENFEACAKATCPAEVDVIEAGIQRMQQDARTARERVSPPGATPAGEAAPTPVGPPQQPRAAPGPEAAGKGG